VSAQDSAELSASIVGTATDIVTEDRRFMALALSLGRRGLGRTWPNPAVGAVIVKNGVIVARGWTQPGGRPHAEIEALRRAGYSVNTYPEEYTKAALATCKGKIKRFGELAGYAGFYFADSVKIDPDLAAKDLTADNKARLQKLRDVFAQVEPFKAPDIEKALKAVAAEFGVKAGLLVHPTRLACTGAAAGPSLYHLMEVLGKKSVLQRIDAAL